MTIRQFLAIRRATEKSLYLQFLSRHGERAAPSKKKGTVGYELRQLLADAMQDDANGNLLQGRMLRPPSSRAVVEDAFDFARSLLFSMGITSVTASASEGNTVKLAVVGSGYASPVSSQETIRILSENSVGDFPDNIEVTIVNGMELGMNPHCVRGAGSSSWGTGTILTILKDYRPICLTCAHVFYQPKDTPEKDKGIVHAASPTETGFRYFRDASGSVCVLPTHHGARRRCCLCFTAL
jgi:hypothetical protein